MPAMLVTSNQRKETCHLSQNYWFVLLNRKNMADGWDVLYAGFTAGTTTPFGTADQHNSRLTHTHIPPQSLPHHPSKTPLDRLLARTTVAPQLYSSSEH